jgi:hypothetical protein
MDAHQPTIPVAEVSQSKIRMIIVAVLIPFSVLTGLALYHHGYWGIVKPHFEAFGPAQVLFDLVIALAIVLVWMWHDAKARGRMFWPWLLMTLAAGCFGPLLYLLTQPNTSAKLKV